MNKNKTQLLRLLFVDKKIREGMQRGELANCSSMASEYEVSAKSILRDIDFLKNQRDAPIKYDPQKRGYYYFEENYSLPAINLKESDLFAIHIAQQVLKQHRGTPIHKNLKKIFGKIEQSLPDNISVNPSWVDSRISVIPEHQTKIDPDIWEIIADSLHRNMTLEIHYKKPEDESPAKRGVDPYHIVNYQGEWYVLGYCHMQKEIRTFAVSRIKKATLLNTAYCVPDDFDFEKSFEKRFGIFGGDKEYDVRIRFAKEQTPYVLEREWHPTQAIETKKDGSVILSITTNHLYEIKRWVLSWGSGAKVIAPQELADEIKDELNKTRQVYA